MSGANRPAFSVDDDGMIFVEGNGIHIGRVYVDAEDRGRIGSEEAIAMLRAALGSVPQAPDSGPPAVGDEVLIAATVKDLLPVTVTTYSWENGTIPSSVVDDEQDGARLDVHGVEVLVHLTALRPAAGGCDSPAPPDGGEVAVAAERLRLALTHVGGQTGPWGDVSIYARALLDALAAAAAGGSPAPAAPGAHGFSIDDDGTLRMDGKPLKVMVRTSPTARLDGLVRGFADYVPHDEIVARLRSVFARAAAAGSVPTDDRSEA